MRIRWADVAVTVGLAIVYFLAAKLGLSLAFVAEQVSPVWPPTGIALAAILLFGYRVSPGIAAGALVANLTANETFGCALGITAGNTLEAVVGAWLLHRIPDFNPSLTRVKDVLGMVILAAAGSTMVSATIGVLSLCLAGVRHWSEFGELWRIWWQGDALGNLVMAPVLLCCLGRRRWRVSLLSVMELAILLGTVVFFSLIVFAGRLSQFRNEYPLEYIIFPFVIWAAFRFGQAGTALITTVIAFIAIHGTVGGFGPFGSASASLHENLMLMQSFLTVVAITGMLLGGAITERNLEENRRALDAAVTQILAESATLAEAAPLIVQAICEHLDCDAGVLWHIESHSRRLRCVSVWHRPEVHIPAFMASCLKDDFDTGTSLPGRVCKSGQPEHIADVPRDPAFVRPSHEGIREAYAVPILLGREVLGVMEFFRTARGSFDTQHLKLVATLGSQIGQFMERKRAEEALRENERRFRSLVEFSWEGISLVDAAGKVFYTSPSTLRDLGYEYDEFVGHPGFEFIHPDDLPAATRLLGELLHNPGGTVTTQYRLRHKSGIWHWMEATGTNLLDEPSVRAIVVNARDVTERRLVAEARERLVAILEATTDFVCIADIQGRFQYLNRAGRQLLGIHEDEDVSDSTIAQYHPDWAYRLVMDEGIPTALREGVWNGETALVSRADGEIPVSQVIVAHKSSGGSVEFVSTIARDIRAQKRLEEQMRQAQKMEAIGRLAGGVAHEFNNQMTVVLGYCQMLLSDLPPGDPAREPVQTILKSGEKAAAITQQLLAFGRKQMLAPRVLSLNTLVEDMEIMLRPLIGEDIELVADLASDLGFVKVDPVQIEQVLLNLVLNARDAMPRGGRLTIATSNVTRDSNNGHADTGARPGRYAMLCVSDTGRGMDATIKEHLFEPFFTTKEVGKGTGLGLAMVYGIVLQSGGHIEVDSEVDRGSAFRVYLPLIQESAAVPAPASQPEDCPRGSETILFVEDEQGVRGLVASVLETWGYRVLTAATGEEALRVCQRHTGPLHLLVTDVVMPQMSGRMLADVLTATFPDIKVLFISGHTDDMVLRHGVLTSKVAFLQKPFSPATLARKIREVFDGASSLQRKHHTEMSAKPG